RGQELPSLLRFGSWIGGDRDGNPYVTPDCTRDALQIARETILDFYIERIDDLIWRLSPSTFQVESSEELEHSLDDFARNIVPGLNLKRHSPQEVYRRYLDYVLERLRSARSETEGGSGYADAADFAADLRLVRKSLGANGGERLAHSLVDPLLRQVETFGFHLHTLDIRQHSRIHTHAREEISRIALLQEASEHDCLPLSLPEPPSSETADLLDSLRMVSVLKRTYPARSIRSYVISETKS